MKFTLFTKVIDEETFTFRESPQEIIRRLRNLNEVSYEFNCEDEGIACRCSARGKIFAGFYTRTRNNPHYSGRLNNIYYVRGEVVSAGNQTVVKIYSVYSWLGLLLQILCTIISILIFGAFFLTILLSDSDSASRILAAGVFACVVIGICCYSLISRLSGYHMNIELLKEEVRKRLDAVRRWEE